MAIFPFILWGAVGVLCFVVYLIVASAIEKSGLARLGATGKLFTCDPDEKKLEAEMKAIENSLK